MSDDTASDESESDKTTLDNSISGDQMPEKDPSDSRLPPNIEYGIPISFTQIVVLLGFSLGVIISWSVFSGDSLGRVNLIHLIFLYVFFPILSLAFSTMSLIFGKGFNFSQIVGYLPFLSKPIKRFFLLQSQKENTKLIFFYQSQLAALSFSFASLLVFILLLLSSDINFVWRSTLMDANFIYPLLKWIAMPWQFWSGAQPDLLLLIATQESRLMAHQAIGINFGDWWRFILAGQIFYAVLLRSVTYIIARLVLGYRLGQAKSLPISSTRGYDNIDYPLAEVVQDVSKNYCLTNWGGLPESLEQLVTSKLSFAQGSLLKAGPLASVSEQLIAERWQETQVVLVKGWEPPMGELADYLDNGKGYLLPLDWKQDKLIPLDDFHLDEWRRFIQPFTHWQLIQLAAS